MSAPAGVGPVLLEPVLIGYPWGDPDTIPRLLGRRPDGRPVAELWIGAEGVPVLVKVLAVAAPLSLQLHPDDESAALGHAAGLAGFTAPYGKPELLLAVSPFLSLSGLRPAAESLAVLAGLGLDRRAAPALRPVLAPVLDALHAGDPAAALAAALTAGEVLAGAVVAALARDRSPGLELVRRVAAVHAGDPALAATLLLRPHRLEPGETLWCPPGCPHVHVSGCGVEVQTDADTTLRAGLTTKPRDPATFLANLRALPPERPEPVRVGAEQVVTAPDGRLRLGVVPDGGGVLDPLPEPSVLLCLRGPASVEVAGDEARLEAGSGAFVAAGAGPVRVAGRGPVFRASTLGRVPMP